MVDIYYQLHLFPRVAVTADDMRAFYDRNVEEIFTEKSAVRFRVIRIGVKLVIAHEPTPGKANALNRALSMVETAYVVTVDADTLLHEQALRRLVSRLESAPRDTVAVAGAVMIRNSRQNLLTRMQEWDYFLGIAAVKRMQGLYQSTLVAQARHDR